MDKRVILKTDCEFISALSNVESEPEVDFEGPQYQWKLVQLEKSSVEPMTKAFFDLTEKLPIQVLHVDDEAGFLKAAKPCLEMQGAFQVDTASCVEEATEKMKKKTYDAIVCDYIMPTKDGLQFLKKLRDSDNNIPFIIFTGKGREEVAIQALNLGADRYFSKIGSPETVYGELAHGISQAAEKRRAEERIRESEEELRSTFDAAVDGIAYVDASGRIISANRRLVEEMLGYELDETIGANFADQGRVDPEDLPRVLEAMTEVLTTGKPVRNFTVRLIRKDGRRILTEISTGVVKKEGRITGVIIIVRDVTEQSRVRKALAESEEKFRNIFENASDAIVCLDGSGRILDVNRKAGEMIGRSRKELLGKHFTKVGVISPRDIPKLVRAFANSLAGKQFTLNMCIRNNKGQAIHLECSSSLLKKEGNVIGSMVIARDITERKKTEELYRSVVDLSPDSIMAVDNKGVITSCNTAATRMLGYSKDEMIGKHFSKIGAIQATDLPKFLKLFSSVLTGKVVKPLELAFYRKNGTLLLAEVRVGLLKADGKAIGVQAVSREITDGKAEIPSGRV